MESCDSYSQKMFHFIQAIIIHGYLISLLMRSNTFHIMLHNVQYTYLIRWIQLDSNKKLKTAKPCLVLVTYHAYLDNTRSFRNNLPAWLTEWWVVQPGSCSSNSQFHQKFGTQGRSNPCNYPCFLSDSGSRSLALNTVGCGCGLPGSPRTHIPFHEDWRCLDILYEKSWNLLVKFIRNFFLDCKDKEFVIPSKICKCHKQNHHHQPWTA